MQQSLNKFPEYNTDHKFLIISLTIGLELRQFFHTESKNKTGHEHHFNYGVRFPRNFLYENHILVWKRYKTPISQRSMDLHVYMHKCVIPTLELLILKNHSPTDITYAKTVTYYLNRKSTNFIT